MRVITENNIFKEFAVFMLVDDDGISRLSVDPDLAYNPDFVKKYIDSEYENVLIFRLELKEPKKIREYIDKLLKEYKSVNWVRDGEFYTRRKK